MKSRRRQDGRTPLPFNSSIASTGGIAQIVKRNNEVPAVTGLEYLELVSKASLQSHPRLETSLPQTHFSPQIGPSVSDLELSIKLSMPSSEIQ